MMNETQRREVRDYMIFGAKLLLELNVRETDGPNDGEVVREIIRFAGGSDPESWCCDFMDLLMDKACQHVGVPHDFDTGRSCSRAVKAAYNLGRYHEDPGKAKPGDFMVLKGGPSGYRHIGLVVQPLNAKTGKIATIEGNTNGAGSADGNGIYRKERDPKLTKMGFISN